MSISEYSLQERLRIDCLWLRRRGNEIVAKDIEEAETKLSKAIELLKEAYGYVQAEAASEGGEAEVLVDGIDAFLKEVQP